MIYALIHRLLVLPCRWHDALDDKGYLQEVAVKIIRYYPSNEMGQPPPMLQCACCECVDKSQVWQANNYCRRHARLISINSFSAAASTSNEIRHDWARKALRRATMCEGNEFHKILSKPQLTVLDRVKASSSILSSKLRSGLTSPGNFLYLLKTQSAILLLIYCGLCLFVFTAPAGFWGYLSCLFLHSICSWWDLK